MNLNERELTTQARNKLPASKFVFQKDRRYPIEDKPHARNALARVSQHGTPSEKKKVRAAVHREYPDIGECQVPALGAAEVAEMHESGCKKCGAQSHSANKCPMNKMARGLDRNIIPPAKACMMGEANEKCPHCGSDETYEAAGGGHRCRRCKKTFKKGGAGDPLMGESIIKQLLNEYPDLDCPQCGGQGVVLGQLGNLIHYRCRQCGYDYSEDTTDSTPPKADIMPGGGSMQLGDTTAIGTAGGGN